jgi:hypothetical protein
MSADAVRGVLSGPPVDLLLKDDPTNVFLYKHNLREYIDVLAK